MSDSVSIDENEGSNASEQNDHDLTNPRGLFPEEVIIHIMSYLDGCTLTRCRLVSKTWKDVFDRSCRYLKPAWKRICFEEIPSLDLNAICTCIDTKYWMIREPWKWEKVYQCWKRWRTSSGWSWRKKRMKLPRQHRDMRVISLKISGNFLVIATADGYLLAFQPSSLAVITLFRSQDISEFHLIANKSRDLFGENDFILEGLAHDEILIICSTEYFRLNLHTGQIRREQKFILLSHPFGYFLDEEVFVHRRRDDFVVVRQRNGEPVAKASFVSPVDIVLVGQETVVSLVKKDCHFSFVFSRTNGNVLEETKSYRISSRMSSRETLRVTPVSETTFILYDPNDHLMECVVGNVSKTYDSRDIFNYRVTCVYHHCGSIFFGTECGFIATLQLRVVNQLLALEEQTFRKLTVTEELASVSDMFLHESFTQPILWVVVTKKLYKFCWW